MEAPQGVLEGPSSYVGAWTLPEGPLVGGNSLELDAEERCRRVDAASESGSSGKVALRHIIKQLQQEGPIEAAAALLQYKPYGEKILKLILHSLIGASFLLSLAVVLSLQIPHGLTASVAADNRFLLLLRAPLAGILLSLSLWLLREAFAAYRTVLLVRIKAAATMIPAFKAPKASASASPVGLVVRLRLLPAQLLVLSLSQSAKTFIGCYTPAAALVAVPAAAAFRSFIKNSLADWGSRASSSSGERSDEYVLAGDDTSDSCGSYKDMVKPFFRAALKAPNFYGLPDAFVRCETSALGGRALHRLSRRVGCLDGLPSLPTTTRDTPEASQSGGAETRNVIGNALRLLRQRTGNQRQPLLRALLLHVCMWVDGLVFCSLCGLLLLPLLHLRAAVWLLGGSPFIAAACCCFAAASAAIDKALLALVKQDEGEWEMGEALNQRLLDGSLRPLRTELGGFCLDNGDGRAPHSHMVPCSHAPSDAQQPVCYEAHAAESTRKGTAANDSLIQQESLPATGVLKANLGEATATGISKRAAQDASSSSAWDQNAFPFDENNLDTEDETDEQTTETTSDSREKTPVSVLRNEVYSARNTVDASPCGCATASGPERGTERDSEIVLGKSYGEVLSGDSLELAYYASFGSRKLRLWERGASMLQRVGSPLRSLGPSRRMSAKLHKPEGKTHAEAPCKGSMRLEQAEHSGAGGLACFSQTRRRSTTALGSEMASQGGQKRHQQEEEAGKRFHTPVMLEECLDVLFGEDLSKPLLGELSSSEKPKQQAPQPRLFIDCTVGGGGHAACIVKRLTAQDTLVCCDIDGEAIAAAHARLCSLCGGGPEGACCEASYKEKKSTGALVAKRGPGIHFVQGNFKFLRELVNTALGKDTNGSVDGIIADLGVSSHQLDAVQRGFSHRLRGPLLLQFYHPLPMDTSRCSQVYVHQKSVENAIAQPSPAEILCCHSDAPLRQCFLLDALSVKSHSEADGFSPSFYPGRLVVLSFHSIEDKIVATAFQKNKLQGASATAAAAQPLVDDPLRKGWKGPRAIELGAPDLELQRRSSRQWSDSSGKRSRIP
ncbi:putative S-adenosyl-methyltransferase mraW [Cyclospora cayetanensis]|uniref:S-adenosyl-methyltransferase mraW n=1 Tax=Cyclospora cayetanensis TaxID=88456 RepID=A0A1D3D5I9_9EIME|nr:putative S-adenosyl-methyltransferase mraW [Cyclospora cayetanensis]